MTNQKERQELSALAFGFCWLLLHRIVKLSADSVEISASFLPVAMATPVPAPAPTPAPIAAPLPPPAIAPIKAPAAAPPPIFVALLLVWLSPLRDTLELDTGMPFTDARRMVISPGVLRRPLFLTYVTLARTESPERATV